VLKSTKNRLKMSLTSYLKLQKPDRKSTRQC